MVTKDRRYTRSPDEYRAKLVKVVAEFGLTTSEWELRYDRWEGAALDFTYKGITRRFERAIDKQTIWHASDCLAQIALSMEKLLWMKREGIFDLDVLTAGLPQLPSPIPECFRELGFNVRPATIAEVEKQFRKMAPTAHPDTVGSDEAFKRLGRAKDEALLLVMQGEMKSK